MRNIETEIQFILESKEYIIDLVEKDFYNILLIK